MKFVGLSPIRWLGLSSFTLLRPIESDIIHGIFRAALAEMVAGEAFVADARSPFALPR